MTKEQSLDQIGALFLTGRQGEDLVISSELKYDEDTGFQSFETMSVETGEKWNVSFRITEI